GRRAAPACLRADREGREGTRRPPPGVGAVLKGHRVRAGGRVTSDWLEELAGSLRGPRRARRRLLAELEGHLEDAAADGLDEATALSRLGSASEVAVRWNADATRRRWQVRAQILAAAVAVAAVAAPVGFAQRPGHAP